MSSPADRNDPDAIAIVGMSCRFSGVASSPDGLWQMLSNGLTGWTNTADNRFNLNAFWHPQASLSGSVKQIIPVISHQKLTCNSLMLGDSI